MAKHHAHKPRKGHPWGSRTIPPKAPAVSLDPALPVLLGGKGREEELKPQDGAQPALMRKRKA